MCVNILGSRSFSSVLAAGHSRLIERKFLLMSLSSLHIDFNGDGVEDGIQCLTVFFEALYATPLSNTSHT